MRRTNSSFVSFVTVSLLLASLTSPAFAKSPFCSPVGGAILTNVGGFGQIGSNPTTLGVATGDLKGAVGVEITGSSGTTFNVQHHWVTENGETLTIEPAIAKGAFVNASGLLAITDYKFTLTGGTGHFANASGDLSAIGEIDFSTGNAILRYSGQVCYSRRD